ncbi:hypothetical protein E6Q11_06745 [Candidatus Dojkabacteria bacterium]|uniref:Uncharacterized protein n=1 Tax=Candidatus Dojkabacteria bacterium TaxID=2099670 RepID=A0A5C7J2P0_9BACT|nr:MAG: hypothetical protein E6Q11_06745 [Candidatus Dojkabacteria bacterium]
MQTQDDEDEQILQHIVESYGVTYQDMLHKFSLGFFLDLISLREEELAAALEEFGKFEWFSGSLSSKVFANELDLFLRSPYSEKLSEKTRVAINEFVEAIRTAQWQANAIDVMRSKNVNLIELAKTGDSQYSTKLTETPEGDVMQMSSRCSTYICEMRGGDKALLLIGNLIHDTRLLVERLGDNLTEVTKYDSAHCQNLIVSYLVSDEKIGDEFWNKIYAKKFSLNLNEIDEPFTVLDATPKLPRCYASKQQANTCHASGLFIAFNDYILRKSHQDEVLAAIQYWETKLSFGNYLLQDGKLQDPRLLHFCNERLKYLRFIINAFGKS